MQIFQHTHMKKYTFAWAHADIAHKRWAECFILHVYNSTSGSVTVIQKKRKKNIVKIGDCDTVNARFWKMKWNQNRPWNSNVKMLCGVSLHLLLSSATHFHLIGNTISTVEIKAASQRHSNNDYHGNILCCTIFVLCFSLAHSLSLCVQLLACKWIVRSITRLTHIDASVLFVYFVDSIKAMYFHSYRLNQVNPEVREVEKIWKVFKIENERDLCKSNFPLKIGMDLSWKCQKERESEANS